MRHEGTRVDNGISRNLLRSDLAPAEGVIQSRWTHPTGGRVKPTASISHGMWLLTLPYMPPPQVYSSPMSVTAAVW